MTGPAAAGRDGRTEAASDGYADGANARVFRLASVLLPYPERELFDGLAELEDAVRDVPRGARTRLGRFLAWLRATPPLDAARHYVETFDLERRRSLYLSYYRHGDTRRRGAALISYKAAYRAAGFSPPDDELPDYLPMLLEFAAVSPRGEALLRRRRTDLEPLRRALDEAGTPYADVVEAVCARLPRLRRREAEAARAMADGPPFEEVGLEPFAPPEYLDPYPRGEGGP
ncbi:nitrate reductase molybdenum cofactor assembly chaperone [Sphaerisporangium siamense]|uniref:Nitrate reductase delta subunit n=1 Tax=Sphaerisporangium siamense TaxID=795645 RepID=A0A7W7DFF8_9ACTN|nr:nitrate reductase molybdenum cofactor assembly chaperone [Sphaerisporangium siamense]MBB4705915.1 nitrate reductase delta subunit [Sphaerisporangium siamense]GII82690.1 nitrate reductase molybdenum cofactor assembly chaperone [Sphaerisporangium siamense]